ncbi:putative Ig domain-containing protein [Streptosporangium sp. NPDC000095]|uniref:putative Ig domain-containing protein n=1 Tax=Streptosporangium sp. NPDC000095 TaxID=3366184 RepID=UPI00369E97BF
MHGRQRFPGLGAIIAGAVTCGVLATPGVAFATPTPDPMPAPPSPQITVRAPATEAPSGTQAPEILRGTEAQGSPAGIEASESSGGTKNPSSLAAHPLLGHFGTAVDRPLTGRITLANPTGERLSFKVTSPTLLPAGITLDADGLLGGTSRVPGTWTVPVEACVPSSGCTTGTVTITITCRCADSPPAPLPPSSSPCSDNGTADVLTT